MLTNGEAINTGYKTYLRLLKYAAPYWSIFILGALAMLIYALTDTGFAYLIKTLTDNFAGTTDGAYIGEWKFNLPVAQKPDSHELCFVPDGDYASFIEKQSPSIGKSGRITDSSGATLGDHDGIHRFTIGQRRGLGISNAVPLYVTQLDAETNTVTVGERSQLEKSNLTASDVNWIAGTPPSSPLSLSVQIRHQHKAVQATVKAEGAGRAHVTFEEPQPAITPGQAAVFYERETVIGGGWID